jgi:hypothetical protein
MMRKPENFQGVSAMSFSFVPAAIATLRPRTLLLAGVCAAAAFAAQAQQPSDLPAMKGEGALRYVCGGIGSDESRAMRAAMKEHPLSLLFARADGAYMADVAVTVQGADDGAAVLALRANGPVCLIDLPAGRYTIDASVGGTAAKRQTVTVGGGPKSASFRF